MESRVRVMLASAAALIAALSAGAPVAIHGQGVLAPVRVTVDQGVEADALDRQAAERYGTPREWRTAARLHERAAALRGPADASASESLEMAAHLYRAAGDLGKARSAMERAASHAAARGDVVTAANAYVDAGLLALENGRDDQVATLARKAETIAYSPLLSELQRATIMNRVGYSQLLAVVDGK